MAFAFDPATSAATKARRGIDFVKAQALWQDEGLADAPVISDDEPRFLVIGRMGGKHCTAVCTQRGDVVRIISVRRARKEEIGDCAGS